MDDMTEEEIGARIRTALRESLSQMTDDDWYDLALEMAIETMRRHRELLLRAHDAPATIQ